MTRRFWIGMVLALLSALAVAKPPAHLPDDAVLSMLVVGTVLVEPDGSVSGWEIDRREVLPDFVTELVGRSVTTWRFEPVLIEGQPRKVQSRMGLLVVAHRRHDSYELAIHSAVFGEGNADAEDGAATGGDGIRPIAMRRPKYPEDALARGAKGTVYLVLQVDRQGRVADIAVEQVNLRIAGTAREMSHMRDMLAEPARRAARKWTFQVPTTGASAAQAFWTIRVPVDYSLEGDSRAAYGQWDIYLPGPTHPIPWNVEGGEDRGGAEAMIAGVPYEAGKGLKLLTPLQPT